MTPDPEFLRKLPYVPRLNEDDILACASAWEADRKRLARLRETALDYFASGLSIRAQFNLEAALEDEPEVPAATP